LKRDLVTCVPTYGVSANDYAVGACRRHGTVQITSGKEHRVAAARPLQQLRQSWIQKTGRQRGKPTTFCYDFVKMAARDCEISTESEDAEDLTEDSTDGKLLQSYVVNGSSDSGSDWDDESEMGKVPFSRRRVEWETWDRAGPCWSEKETHEPQLLGAFEQEARQGQNLRGDLLILNKTIYLILFLCARLTNCNDFEQVFVYDCPLSSKYNCNCPAKLRVSWGPKQVVKQKRIYILQGVMQSTIGNSSSINNATQLQSL
jgi:hypothetical protein